MTGFPRTALLVWFLTGSLTALLTGSLAGSPSAAGSDRVIQVHLGAETENDANWVALRAGVDSAGAAVSWERNATSLSTGDSKSGVAFLQSLSGNRTSETVGGTSTPPTTRAAIDSPKRTRSGDDRPWDTSLSVGDMVLLRPGERLRIEDPSDWLAFSRDAPWPEDLPSYIRPDMDPQLTDTPGGCATEAGAYRRVCLTWQGKNGPYLDRLINSHRVRIRDSFSHYHPIDGGFDELYLVQDALPGAELIVGEKLERLLDPSDLSADEAGALLRHIPLQTNDLVFLPRGTMHRGVGGVLAHVITLPGFVPGAEIPVDDAIADLNARFDLDLPIHRADQPFVAALVREDRVRVEIDDQLFTQYLCDRARPCFYPVHGPSGAGFTRGYPIDPRADEAEDHPHHTSLWFAHGDVDGHDFWHDPSTAMHLVSISDVYSRPGEAGFSAMHEWRAPDGSVVLMDRRVFRIQAHGRERSIDWDLTLTAPASHAVHFGDTKEGTMAMRTHPRLRVTGPVANGALTNDHGLQNGAAWGKRSRWMLNTGDLGGVTGAASIAVLEHPQSFRSPTWWHAREYGLVAANPFGVRAFTGTGQDGGAESGDFDLAAGNSIRLRYRFVFSEEILETEDIDRRAKAFGARE